MAEGTRMPPQFLKYWVAGPGAARIAWNTPGDFDRCIANVQEEVTKDGSAPLPDRMIKGACATMHKMATGGSPGHGSAEHEGH